MPDLIFVDTETVSLAPTGDAVWEVAAIDGEGTGPWLRHNKGKLLDDPHQINAPHDRRRFASEFMRLTWGKHLVGANPAFDALRLADLLTKHGACVGWHHRLIDVEVLALGWMCGQSHDLGLPMDELGLEELTAPYSQSKTAELLGIVMPEAEHHTALGDARTAKKIYEKVCL